MLGALNGYRYPLVQKERRASPHEDALRRSTPRPVKPDLSLPRLSLASHSEPGSCAIHKIHLQHKNQNQHHLPLHGRLRSTRAYKTRHRRDSDSGRRTYLDVLKY
jgi:hypothetical protein